MQMQNNEKELTEIKIVCIVVTHNRQKITTETINMLKKQTIPIQIILVGDQEPDKEVAIQTGVVYVNHVNLPLGKKWQSGVNKAREFNPDGIMICGSDSWISPHWVESAKPFLSNYNLIGINRFNACKIVPNEKVIIIRRAYKSNRSMIPIGSGRIFSKDLLDKVDWKIFAEGKNVCLDMHTMLKTRNFCNIKICNEIEQMQVLSIKSTWDSLSSWDMYVKSTKLQHFPNIKKPKRWLQINFPGSIQAFAKVIENIVW